MNAKITYLTGKDSVESVQDATLGLSDASGAMVRSKHPMGEKTLWLAVREKGEKEESVTRDRLVLVGDYDLRKWRAIGKSS